MLFMLGSLCLARAGLLLWQAERVSSAQAWSHVWLEGWRFDGVLLGLYWVLPAALTPWVLTQARWLGPWAHLLRGWGLVGVLLVVFMELATPAFVLQYDSRPNYLFVEYLAYVQEVGGTLVKGYWPHLLAALLCLPLSALLYLRWTRPQGQPATLRAWQALPLSLLLFVGLALCGRGALGHRPANPATAALTADHLVNQLPLSSLYSVLYAVHQARKSAGGGITYGDLPHEHMIALVRQATGLPENVFTDPQRPLSHTHTARFQRPRPMNLIVVLEESLGAEFVGELGGLPLTPHLDRLSREGIWFEQLYATGTRSVRGIEAVVAGYPPTSAVSTVKQAVAQRNFFTIASYLKPHGYASTFFYGGESHFDNMRSFFMGNGFDRVIEQKDMGPDAFVATWGASDGDVFERAHAHFLTQDPGQPFFGLIFTSSNHEPFEFPPGQIELHETPAHTVNNAVKYADHALGRFIDQARQSPYWSDTVVLIVADHNARVYGRSLLPVKRFHIPGLILGGPIEPGQRIPTVASQIDLAPTLFSLMGVSGPSPLIGRDLTDPAQQALPGRAILQFDAVQGYLSGQDLVLLQANKPPLALRYEQGELQPADAAPPGLVEQALAHALYARAAYRAGWHR